MNIFGERYPEGVTVDTAIGDVTISKKSIKNSLSHLIYPAKLDSILSLPKGLKVAAYMESSPDKNGKEIMNHFLVYPIKYNGEKRYVVCRVREIVGEKRLYVHGVYSENDVNKKVNTFLQTTPLENQVQRGGADLYDDIIAKFFSQGKQNQDRYSIDPSDNSNESWSAKAKNYISAWWKNADVKSQRFNRQQTLKLQKASDYRILYEHYIDDDPVIVDKYAKVIRAKDNYEWETLLPAVVEAIAEKVGLNPSDKMNNYIADWLFTGALNNTSTEATEFARAMGENPALFELLQDIQENFQEFANMSALDKYGSIIAYEKPNPNTQSFMDRMEEEIVDDTSPLGKLTKEIREKYGDNIADALDSQFAARMYRGGGGIIDLMTRAKNDKQIEDIREILTSENPFVNFVVCL